jgi:hypothetical protein
MQTCNDCNLEKEDSCFFSISSTDRRLRKKCNDCVNTRWRILHPSNKRVTSIRDGFIICIKCNVEKPKGQFYFKGGEGSERYRTICKKCQNAETNALAKTPKGMDWCRNYSKEYNKTPFGKKSKRFSILKVNYKITEEDFNVLLESQNYRCAICKTDRPLGKGVFNIDHDHLCCPTTSKNTKTCGKCIRGLLCSRCNTGLGFLDDNIDNLYSAITYLTPKPIGDLDSNSLFIINPKYCDDRSN